MWALIYDLADLTTTDKHDVGGGAFLQSNSAYSILERQQMIAASDVTLVSLFNVHICLTRVCPLHNVHAFASVGVVESRIEES